MISNKRITALLKMLTMTKDVEEGCDGCLTKIAEFAELSLAGKSVPEGLQSIDDHLKICGECREEFQALRTALSNEVNE